MTSYSLYAEAAPTAEPGAEFHYSNAGFVLLGALVEEVTGQEFVPAVTQRVLRPAGMASSGYFRSDEPVPDVAVGYLRRTEQQAPWRSNVFSVPVIGSGDGGAHATPRDLDRFLRAIASGDLLGGDVSAQMRSRHVRVADGSGTGTASTSVPTEASGTAAATPASRPSRATFPTAT